MWLSLNQKIAKGVYTMGCGIENTTQYLYSHTHHNKGNAL